MKETASEPPGAGMGIYDRDYYRDDSRSVFGAFGNRARVTTALILINVFVFLLQVATIDRVESPRGQSKNEPGWVTTTYSLAPEAVMEGEVWRLLTYSFLHSPASLWHILFNMLMLWWFGSAVEDLYGSKEFLAFYLVAAFLGGLGVMASWASGLEQPGAYVIGASGAVTAVLIVFACHYPHHTVFLLFLPIPVWLLVAVQIGKDLLGLMGATREPVAFACHLSGAAFGFLYHYFHWRVLNWVPTLPAKAKPRSTQLRVFREEPDEEPPPAPLPPPRLEVDEHLEAQLDRVLEKVARHGQDSLTPAEREVLFRASEVYKKRRK